MHAFSMARSPERRGGTSNLHRRPGRSLQVRGRDLVHRADLRAPPGGYDPELLYHVPRYFTMAKLRTRKA